jgi:hypothetical protein
LFVASAVAARNHVAAKFDWACLEIEPKFISRQKEFPTLMPGLRNHAEELVRKLFCKHL